MPRDLLIISPNFEKRRVALRDTVEKLSTEEKRNHCRKKAAENHERWQAERATESAGKVRVIAGDWGEVTQRFSKESGVIYAALNMANAVEPGGGYIEGWGAQEENMFRRTDCHFCITDESMNAEKNRYTQEMTDLINAKNNRVFFDKNPRVCIKGKEDSKDPNLGYQDLPENEYFLFYELRSAADNLDPGHTGSATIPFDRKNMERKIAAQLDTLIANNIRHVVLSAFGCGAFANPADQVAEIYRDAIQKRRGHFDDVVFAIFYAGYGPDNFTPFKTVLDGFSLTPPIPKLKETFPLTISGLLAEIDAQETQGGEKIKSELKTLIASKHYSDEQLNAVITTNFRDFFMEQLNKKCAFVVEHKTSDRSGELSRTCAIELVDNLHYGFMKKITPTAGYKDDYTLRDLIDEMKMLGYQKQAQKENQSGLHKITGMINAEVSKSKYSDEQLDQVISKEMRENAMLNFTQRILAVDEPHRFDSTGEARGWLNQRGKIIKEIINAVVYPTFTSFPPKNCASLVSFTSQGKNYPEGLIVLFNTEKEASDYSNYLFNEFQINASSGRPKPVEKNVDNGAKFGVRLTGEDLFYNLKITERVVNIVTRFEENQALAAAAASQSPTPSVANTPGTLFSGTEKNVQVEAQKGHKPR